MRKQIEALIKTAGALAQSYFLQTPAQRAKRNPADIVTEADEAVSAFIVERLAREYPDHQIHSEEQAEDINPGAQYCWIIDPIDGTRNFAMGMPCWCVMIGLLRDGVPILGAVYCPLTDQLYFAERGAGAFLNGAPIRIGNPSSFDHGLAVIVSDRSDGVLPKAFNGLIAALLENTTAWFANYATMLAACFLAQGRLDLYAHNAGHDYDYTAPAVICREAGALVTTADGQEWTPGRKDLVIAGPALHGQVLQMLSARLT